MLHRDFLDLKLFYEHFCSKLFIDANVCFQILILFLKLQKLILGFGILWGLQSGIYVNGQIRFGHSGLQTKTSRCVLMLICSRIIRGFACFWLLGYVYILEMCIHTYTTNNMFSILNQYSKYFQKNKCYIKWIVFLEEFTPSTLFL